MRARIAIDAYKTILSIAEQWGNLEAGGVLLGHWRDDPGEPVILAAISPGPAAKHSAHSFRPDYEHDESEIARHYNESDGQVVYLGDWHSHPGGKAELSAKDVGTLIRIARYQPARVPRPLMLIVAGPPWKVCVWMGIRPHGWHWPPRIATIQLDPVVFDDL